MKFSGGALTQGKIAGGCILFLGFTAGTGLTFAEIQKSLVSSALAKLGGWVVGVFNWNGSPPPPTPSQPIDPVPAITQAWSTVSDASTTVFGAVSSGYQWIVKSENSLFLATFLKNFWDFSFVKDVVFNLHLTIRAWLGVLFDSNALSKFSEAFQTFNVLAQFLSKDDTLKNGDKDMINWLYLRLMVNPRRTINVLKRGSKNGQLKGEDDLKCNGAKKKKKKERVENLPLGICFICQSKNQLIDQIKTFLKEGKMPEETKKQEK